MTAIINLLDWINTKIVWVCRWLTILLVASSAVNVFIGVFFRYGLNNSLAWYEESAKYMMLWLAFTGAPIVLKQRGHISLDLLTRMLPARLQHINYVIIYAVVLFLLCAIAYHGFGLAINARAQELTSIELSFFWVYIAIPFGCAVMAMISLQFLLMAILGIFKPEEVDLSPGGMTDNSMT